MIDFKLTEEQVALKETVRKFVQSEIIPNAHRFDATSEFPHEIIRKAWENGLMNPAVPEKIGGLGLGILEDVIMNEEMGAGCLGMTTSIAVNTLALYPILIGGTDEQIKHWITPFLNEPKLASFCLTEPGAGSDAGGLSLHAKDEGSHF
ncbi:MAG: acyl-CoA dehydrogenase, partial [Proteobacteria bacterium]|nr:acyl-CoA dehydrogenase [Pseudomonadota bacterium]